MELRSRLQPLAVLGGTGSMAPGMSKHPGGGQSRKNFPEGTIYAGRPGRSGL